MPSAIDTAAGSGVGRPTEGSEWIVRCARRADPRPLWVLVWGGIEDLAQALHDAPDILPKLRVYFIGGPNKMWSVDAYDYIETHHPSLWMIEANSTYRGWFVGGDQSGEWDNRAFAATHAKGRGALGDYLRRHFLSGVLKMGDSPSVGYLLSGASPDPGRGGWGGRFVRVWAGPEDDLHAADHRGGRGRGVRRGRVQDPCAGGHDAQPSRDHGVRRSHSCQGRGRRRAASLQVLTARREGLAVLIESDFAALQGLKGDFTAVLPPPARTARRSPAHPNWWTDDPDPAAAEGIHRGARTVNQWRVEFLRDFADRLRRTTPLPKLANRP